MSWKVYNAYEYTGKLQNLRKALYKASASFKPLFDGDEKGVTIYFYGDRIFVHFFNFDFRFSKLSSKFFKDFHWQTSTDRPDEVSSKDWLYREKVWRRIFDDFFSPNEAGFSLKFPKTTTNA